MSKNIENLLEELPENERQTINILNKVQEEKGFIPQPLLAELADILEVPESQLHSLVSFLVLFELGPLANIEYLFVMELPAMRDRP